MLFPIKVPDLGTGDEPIRLCGWLADQGDLISAGDPVAEILIPGITMEITAESSGRLLTIVKPIDARIYTGDVLGWLEDVDQ